jgi:peptide-methionine (R)-S-oxide reductase
MEDFLRMFIRKNFEFEELNRVEGVFLCSGCSNPLFEQNKKFDSGTGYPSFYSSISINVKEVFLDTYGRGRIQIVCSCCLLHLGHLFADDRTPSKKRYCVVKEAIKSS